MEACQEYIVVFNLKFKNVNINHPLMICWKLILLDNYQNLDQTTNNIYMVLYLLNNMDEKVKLQLNLMLGLIILSMLTFR
jgi:hypothetical protein